MRMSFWPGAPLVALVLSFGWTQVSAESLRLRDGDRVAFVGNALFELAQEDDYLECRLTSREPRARVLFRNLGWSGDTVFGDARAGFDTPVEGFARLKGQIEDFRPTLVFLWYGGNEAFAGAAGLESFGDGLDRLLDVMAEIGARVVLMTPLRHENLGSPLPDPAEYNRQLAGYQKVIAKRAAERDHMLVDVDALLLGGGDAQAPCPLTTDGMHLTSYGYWEAAAAIEHGLGLSEPTWTVDFDFAESALTVRGTVLTRYEITADGLVFEAIDQRLPAPRPPGSCGAPPNNDMTRILRANGLPPGRYVLSIDSQPVLSASAIEWSNGVRLNVGPEFEQVEALRQAIRAKNRLFFHRWRPQNETYLFGFRKHEQGQNAVEIPAFDPLVAAKEAEIAELAQPRRHRYELLRESEASQ